MENSENHTDKIILNYYQTTRELKNKLNNTFNWVNEEEYKQ